MVDPVTSALPTLPDVPSAGTPRASSRRESLLQRGDVAKVILEAATAEAPHLRYQTSDFARGIAARVRVDPTGDTILQQTSAQLGD